MAVELSCLGKNAAFSVFENKAMRTKVTAPKRNHVISWRNADNEEFRDLYSSTSIVRTIKFEKVCRPNGGFELH